MGIDGIKALTAGNLKEICYESGVDPAEIEAAFQRLSEQSTKIHSDARNNMGEFEGAAAFWLAQDMLIQSSIRLQKLMPLSEAADFYYKVAIIAADLHAAKAELLDPHLIKIQEAVNKNPEKYLGK